MASDRAHHFSFVGVGSLRRTRRAAIRPGPPADARAGVRAGVRADARAGVRADARAGIRADARAGVRVAVRTTGRHRVGADGLRHCADLAAVGERLGSRTSIRSISQRGRHRRRERMRLTAQLVTGVASIGASAVVLISGWYAAAGAAAVAQMVAR